MLGKFKTSAAARLVAFPIVLLGVLFGSAGRLDLPWMWVYAGIMCCSALAACFLLEADLKAERMRPGPGEKDRLTIRLMLPVLLVHWVVAGLDVGRFHWSDGVPVAARLAGAAVMSATLALTVWAMRVNRFFSSAVRIQSERGHRLVTTGPYRFVRHPGYLAGLVGTPAGALVLGSWWAMAPLIVQVLALLRRTALEDRLLREELPDYEEYAHRVRYRLIPGIW